MKNIALYFHSGSANHGCEAIVRSTYKICESEKYQHNLFSFKPYEDIFYQLNRISNIKSVGFKRFSLPHIIAAFKYKILQDKASYDELSCKNIWKSDHVDLALAIGGDNYCYANCPTVLANINRKLNEIGIKTVLWGCSVEPEILKDPKIVDDMIRYSLIIARESITYNALIKAGVTKNTKLYPDPAFALDKIELELPINFVKGKTVGINLSPLVQRLEKVEGVTYNNYRELIKYIIEKTDNNVALIPHVVWKSNNDLELLRQLYTEFKNTNRVVLIEDHNCLELKGFISRCCMFIGARTHATIAAYSSCVPTLVVGYSVKSKGIAKDIFGTYENYVIPVQSLQSECDLINAYKWLEMNENEMRNYLKKFMPAYIEKAWQACDEVKNIMD